MPFKKRRKNKSESTKEKKAIATRLMVISLMMDDYIYKDKSISAQDAQMYIEELASYRSQCINDVRSRQVIEKLTLFMKSIIKENTISSIRCDNSNSETDIGNTNTLSTIVVNTNTNCEDIIEKNTVNVCAVDNLANFAENKNKVNYYIDTQNNIDADSFSNLSLNPGEHLNKDAFDQTKHTLDVNNDELSKINSIPIQKQSEVTSIARAACNINLNDIENANTTFNDNVLRNNTNNILNKPIQCIIDKVENNKGTENVTALSNVCIVSFQHGNNDSSMNLKNTRDKIDLTDKPNRKRNNKTVRTKKESKTKVTNKDKKRQRKQTNAKKNCEKNLNNNTGSSENSKCCNIEKEYLPDKKRQRKQTNAKKNRDKNINNNIGSSENSKCCNIEKEYLPDTVSDKDIDLSWIEDIKYVREVRKDEYDLTLNNLEETFWNDLTLPVNWNFNDFDNSDQNL